MFFMCASHPRPGTLDLARFFSVCLLLLSLFCLEVPAQGLPLRVCLFWALHFCSTGRDGSSLEAAQVVGVAVST